MLAFDVVPLSFEESSLRLHAQATMLPTAITSQLIHKRPRTSPPLVHHIHNSTIPARSSRHLTTMPPLARRNIAPPKPYNLTKHPQPPRRHTPP